MGKGDIRLIRLYEEDLAVARGEEKADLVLREARVVNVYSGEIHLTDLAVHRGRIIGWGRYQGKEERDLQGRYILPGLIDAHSHLESTMLLPGEFCRHVVPRGVTTVALDPHELANVAGIRGIDFFRRYVGRLPINLLIQLPSCVPATPADESGATLQAEDLAPLLELPGIHGLGEMMNFFGVVQGDRNVIAKLAMAEGRFIDGHAPLLKGNELNAYVWAGINADHESTEIEEAREKLRRGMYVMVREGSAAKDLQRLLPLIEERNARRFVLCTDDRHPLDLAEEGHMDDLLRKAIHAGLHPVEAVRMATLNAAECLGRPDLGAIAPGKRADLVAVTDLHDFHADEVYKDGQLVAVDGRLVQELAPEGEISLTNTVRVGELRQASLRIPAGGRYRVMQVHPGQIITHEVVRPVRIEEGRIIDPDVLKIAAVERYRQTGHVGVGLIQGIGLREGAIASSIAHDSHNLIAVGRDDRSILLALEELIRMQGGLVLVRDGQVAEALPLPIGGLLSDRELPWVVAKLRRLHRLAHDGGVVLTDPFMTLAFMALPVIPELKITTLGLFDVRQNRLVPLVLE